MVRERSRALLEMTRAAESVSARALLNSPQDLARSSSNCHALGLETYCIDLINAYLLTYRS